MPPFPDGHPIADPRVPNKTRAPKGPSNSVEQEALFDALCNARVGGTFWGNPVCAVHPDRGSPIDTVVRTSGSSDEFSGSEEAAICSARSGLGIDVDAQEDPWSILPNIARLAAHGDDEWIVIASAIGIDVEVLTSGRFGSPGESKLALIARAFDALSAPIQNPFTGAWMEPLEAIALLKDWRRMIDGNRGGKGEQIVAACGISWWKKAEIRQFLWSPDNELVFLNRPSKALSIAKKKGGALAIWPSRVPADFATRARQSGVNVVQVEDGFVRSAGLGSNLVPPQSVTIDRQGMHFDPSSANDLEELLVQTHFEPDLLARAAKLRQTVVSAGISKYSGAGGGRANSIERTDSRRLVLVPGQVEDDLSVVAGGKGLTSNLELLRRTRALEPDAEIWWRPHPDVDAGHRKGAIEDAAALKFADRVVREGTMPDLLKIVDAVHVLTSLSGFEALMRGCDVTCHGVPFYAGWGLTRDLAEMPTRRGRQLSLDQLVAGALILYPRYLDPITQLPCPPEILVERMSEGQSVNRMSWVTGIRRLQGRLAGWLRRWGLQ